MTTALDIITDALLKNQFIDSGTVVTDTDAQLGLTVLNNMMDSWSNESLSCFYILQQSGTMVVNQWQYQIGIGAADFNIVRPLRILENPGTAYLQDPNGNRYPVAVRPLDQWNLIGNILQVNSNVPTDIFYDPQYPFGIINVFPIPNISWVLNWDSYAQLMDFANLTTVLSLPPGYEKAVKDNLAVELFPYFCAKGEQINPVVVAVAARSKGNVQRTNLRPNVAVYDPELVARPAQSTYNIYRDTGR